MSISKMPTPWVPIFLYHRVVPVLPAQDPYGNCVDTNTFEKQLQWLSRRGYQSISFADLEPSFAPKLNGTGKFPSRPFILTFDDGYQDNYQHAWPLLQRYGFTATIFLVTDAIGGDNRFDNASGCDHAPMLTIPEIEEMHRQGIQFESHTCSHPENLTELPDDKLQDELQRSRDVLQNLLHVPSRYFSYPHSQLDSRVENAVRQAGYTLACAGVGTRFSPFCLHRVEPGNRQGLSLEAYLKERYLKWLIKSRHS
jgi:peptidoglycan/xylan/chitin deacetylase (PgdA/CDA1 family)